MRVPDQYPRWLPADHDPLAPRTLATSAHASKRLIVALRSDSKSDRYLLHRFPNGSVAWRADTFTAPEHPTDPERWIAHHGELSVEQVIDRLPEHRHEVLAWTRAEIARGLDVVEVAECGDPLARELRARSLARLAAELEVAAAAPSAAGRAA